MFSGTNTKKISLVFGIVILLILRIIFWESKLKKTEEYRKKGRGQKITQNYAIYSVNISSYYDPWGGERKQNGSYAKAPINSTQLVHILQAKLAHTPPPRRIPASDVKSKLSTNNTVAPISIPETPLRYNRAIGSGLGDRLSLFMNLAALGRAVRRDVYVYWEINERLPRHHHARKTLQEIKEHFYLPENLNILEKPQFLSQTSGYIDIEFTTDHDPTVMPGYLRALWALDSVYTTAWRTFRLPPPLHEPNGTEFAQAYRRVAEELDIRKPSDATTEPSFLNEKYIVLHVRGTDKPAPLYEFNTQKILSLLPAKSTIVAITDDESLLDSILTHSTIRLPNVIRLDNHKIRNDTGDKDTHDPFRDFRILLGAIGIIQHSPSGWSAFSSLASMLRQIPLINTWIGPLFRHDSRAKYLGILAGVESAVVCPEELQSANREDEVEKWILRMTGAVWSVYNTLWIAIVTPKKVFNRNDHTRERHVGVLLRRYPFMHRFHASLGVDESCCSILRSQNMTIGGRYYSDEMGVGWVHMGKIGNWCSFLRFLQHCSSEQKYESCVWIENDVLVTDSMLSAILKVSADMKQGIEGFPVVHLYGTWEVVVVQRRRARDILSRFYNFEIIRPIDSEFWSMRGEDNLLSDKKILKNTPISISTHRENSTIVCSNCSLVTTDSVNRLCRTTIPRHRTNYTSDEIE